MGLEPVYGLTVGVRRPIVLYWESYGLRPDSSGVRRYAVRLDVAKAGGGDRAVRVLRGLTGLFGSDRSTTVQYDGTSTDARAPDWLALEGIQDAGRYVIHLTITDRVSGAVTKTERTITVR